VAVKLDFMSPLQVLTYHIDILSSTFPKQFSAVHQILFEALGKRYVLNTEFKAVS
jgi:hypothetical protein